MGSCFSVKSKEAFHTGKVINADGSLTEFSEPLPASHLLNGSQSEPFFCLCNADGLSYGQTIQSLGSDSLTQTGQLYFVLPAAMCGKRLEAAVMARLAARASSAFSAKKRRRKLAVQVSPLSETALSFYMIINELSVGSSSSSSSSVAFVRKKKPPTLPSIAEAEYLI